MVRITFDELLMKKKRLKMKDEEVVLFPEKCHIPHHFPLHNATKNLICFTQIVK
jgi:hypothetical protein